VDDSRNRLIESGVGAAGLPAESDGLARAAHGTLRVAAALVQYQVVRKQVVSALSG